MSERGRKLSWQTGLVVFLGYLALVAVLIARWTVIGHLDTNCLCTESSDPTQFAWLMVWWPHAVGSGINPFVTHSMWAPGPFNLATATSIPLASIVATPVTLTLGPLAAANVLVIVSPALAGFLAFRLCFYLSGRLAPALVGGFIFGFSGYVLGQMIGHLNLMMVFLGPLAVHLVLRRIDGRIGTHRFVASIAAVIAGQALLSTELLLTSVIFGAIAVVAGYFFADPRNREGLRRVALEIIVGGVVATVVISPFLYYALFYSSQPEFVPATRFSMDALNPIIPTPVQRIGRTSFEPVAVTFPGGYAEAGGYLGIAFVLLGGWWLALNWKTKASRIMLVMLVFTIVASLGTALYISGNSTISLPWKLIAKLPLLEQVIPVRLAMYTSLIAAIAVTFALAARTGLAWLRWGLAIVGVLMLLPSGGSALFHSTPPDPSFFTSDQYKQYLQKEETALVLPFSTRGQSLLWQARTNMYFRLAGGYLGQVPPQEYAEEPAVTQMLTGVANAETPCLLKSFIENRQVGAVLMESASTEPWRPALAELGLQSKEVGGVDVYQVPKSLSTPTSCS